MLNFKKNNGGRKKAGYKGHVRDCVARALSIIRAGGEFDDGSIYKATYKELAQANKEAGGKKTARNGLNYKVYGPVYKKHGLKHINIAKTKKLTVSEVYATFGNCIATYPGHAIAIIDGAVHDTWDSRVFPKSKSKKETLISHVWIPEAK